MHPGAKPDHLDPFLVPRAHKVVFCKELERLFQQGLLKKVNRSEWGALTFIQPRNNRTVGLLPNFRKINQRIHKKTISSP